MDDKLAKQLRSEIKLLEMKVEFYRKELVEWVGLEYVETKEANEVLRMVKSK